MKIGVLSDIHGNAIALEATLAEARESGIRRLFILGDMVGYYYRPLEVLRQLEEFETTFIRGNHELMLASARNDAKDAARIKKKYGSGIAEALRTLSEGEVRRFIELPETASVKEDGVDFFLCHGSPWKSDEYVYPDAPRATLEKCASVKADFVLMGHTHRSFAYAAGGGTVVNPGSVGQSREQGGFSSWAVIDTANRAVVFRRTPYDIAPVVKEVKKHDPGIPYLEEVLRRNTV